MRASGSRTHQTADAARPPIIQCRHLDVGYGDLRAAGPIDLSVAPGEAVALIGANGAGKTTILYTLAGVLRPLGGEVLWAGRPTNAPLHVRARQGLAFISDRKSVTTSLSVKDNLRVASVPVGRAIDLFPELRGLLDRPAGVLSGGERQMLTVARALGRLPDAVVVDELSLGLAPLVAERLYGALRAAVADGVAVLLVEQDLRLALSLTDRFYLLRDGKIQLSEKSALFRDRLTELAEMLVLSEGDRQVPSEGDHPVLSEGDSHVLSEGDPHDSMNDGKAL
jgi:branched-chain amino acid transport system ATP-binding protein